MERLYNCLRNGIYVTCSMYEQLLRYYKKGLNSWIELYNNDSFKTKREKKRINYYINKLNEFERLLND